jgi:hypothetical protein
MTCAELKTVVAKFFNKNFDHFIARSLVPHYWTSALLDRMLSQRHLSSAQADIEKVLDVGKKYNDHFITRSLVPHCENISIKTR